MYDTKKKKFDFNYIVRLQDTDAPNDQHTQLLADRLFSKFSGDSKAIQLDWDPRGAADNVKYINGKKDDIPPLGENTRLYFLTHGQIGETNPAFSSLPKNLRYNLVNWSGNSQIQGFHGGGSKEDVKTSSPRVSSFIGAIAKTNLFKNLGFSQDKDSIRKIGRISIVACNTVDPDNYSENNIEHFGFAKNLYQQLTAKRIETEVSARFGYVSVDALGRKNSHNGNNVFTSVKSKGQKGKIIFRKTESRDDSRTTEEPMDID